MIFHDFQKFNVNVVNISEELCRFLSRRALALEVEQLQAQRKPRLCTALAAPGVTQPRLPSAGRRGKRGVRQLRHVLSLTRRDRARELSLHFGEKMKQQLSVRFENYWIHTSIIRYFDFDWFPYVQPSFNRCPLPVIQDCERVRSSREVRGQQAGDISDSRSRPYVPESKKAVSAAVCLTVGRWVGGWVGADSRCR